MAIITANLLDEGTPVWWTGSVWHSDMALAARLDGKQAEALLGDLSAQFATQVASLEVAPFNRDDTVPRRQRIRQLGPTVRPDLGPLNADAARIAA
ncbi:MAG: DUF2849 domain-containing protein [Hyphomonadaceae bacterium]|jgi:hypothetical protein|nr:DUF2849 domain-containing protein [Hyphomonadaceae bacterium]